MAEKESDLQYYSKKLPAPLRNKYVFVGLLFVLWMLFFDRNNVISQFRLRNSLNGLKDKKEHHQRERDDAQRQWTEIFSNDATLEKFAREKHFMKRSNEDIFIVEDK